MSDLYNHVRSDKVKWVLTLFAFIVVAVMLAGIICGWFEKKEKTEEQSHETATDGGMVVGNAQSGGVALMSARIMSAEYEDYGVNALADTAYTLTATIEPSDATNKSVDYTAAWKNANSTWAKGKDVADYVTVQQASEGSLNATVTCLQAFGEQVIITCTVTDNIDLKATCTVDYLRKPLGANLNIAVTGAYSGEEEWNFNYAAQNASVDFPLLKNVSSFDQDWVFGWCNVSATGGTGTCGNYSFSEVYSDTYTIDNSVTSMTSWSVSITQEYYDILEDQGFNLDCQPEKDISQVGVDGGLSIGNLILGFWTNNTFNTYQDYVDLRTALKPLAGKPLFRIKYYFVSAEDDDLESGYTQVYNVSFSASSFSNILANGVSLNNSSIIF